MSDGCGAEAAEGGERCGDGGVLGIWGKGRDGRSVRGLNRKGRDGRSVKGWLSGEYGSQVGVGL